MTNPNFEEQVIALLVDHEGMTLRNVKLFLGEKQGITKHEICREMHSALMQEAMGKAIVSTSFVDTRPTVNVQEFLSAL